MVSIPCFNPSGRPVWLGWRCTGADSVSDRVARARTWGRAFRSATRCAKGPAAVVGEEIVREGPASDA
ncbi:hypothetical protein [Niveispirillum sp. SYP-B3756]|uniref:hypothetical protein n=1 Tax=Niveispirillum sp. SYP-B3756 TaxID=2662178 RepID=UPI001B3BD8C5|nr:hypothetical protein [Niveispirillum sp. SYP-B3756]